MEFLIDLSEDESQIKINELPRSKLRGARTAQVDDLNEASHSDLLGF